VLFAGFSVLGIRTVDASTNRILHERLAITEELAEDVDGVLQHRFANLTAFDARPASAEVRQRLLSEVYRSAGGAFTTLALLDASGTVRGSLGSGAPPVGTDLSGKPYVASALAQRKRLVSAPFRDSVGKPVVALSVPVARGTLVGTLDLASEDVIHRLDAAQRLGRSGHAELVGPNGIELASTETSATLARGEHLAFYRKMLRASQPGIADVPVTPNQGEPAALQRAKHVMAFVRLSTAPWGVALGGTDSETYAPARQLRRTLLLAGGGALVALWLLTLLGARLLVRPVRSLTSAAEEMASGNLDRTVSVSEGGEIGVLAGSLEAMRVQLKDSLETVRRWGEELEVKVGARTAELNARNRQLAAVSAIMAAADESHDLEGMLHRCLDVVLGQTAMDAAAVRLLDDGSGRPLVVVARGGWSGFPDVDRLAVLPLRGPSGVLGELTLGRRDGRLPTAEEQPIVTAVCDQIAVAVDNLRLAAELRNLEAQHEVQRMRTELISAVSHELRTPLGFIKSYATTLLREDTPIAPETRRHFLEIIDEETEKLEHMIEELLDVSRLQAGRLPIELSPILLGEIVARAIDKVRPTVEAEGHMVSLRLPEEPVAVFADALRIEQVVDNLVENAARYSDPGTPIEVTLGAEEGHVLLGVTNVGGGVPTAELEQIFEPFYRGAEAKQRRVRGAGLGLAICRGIVEAHGGRIWVENADHRTTFLLTLPLNVGEPV
jgi:signal transduction histidine kinase/HAMP domain-containing protein